MKKTPHIPNQQDNSAEYRERLVAMATQALGKDALSFSKYQMIEAFCKCDFDRRVWMQTAMSFECQLYMVDPNNEAFVSYPKEKIDAIKATVERWKQEIIDAEKKAKDI